MQCNHEPFAAESTLYIFAVVGGTDLVCRACNSTARFDILGQLDSIFRVPVGANLYGDSAGTYAEVSSPPAEHIVLDGELVKWRCERGNEHDLGELCACTHE